MSDKHSGLQQNKEKNPIEWDAVILAIVATIIVIAEIIVYSWFLCFKTVPKFSEKNLELGNDVPANIYNYVTGAPFMHKDFLLDVSEVDNMHVGNYCVVVSGKEDFEFILHVVDTTAPEIELLGSLQMGMSDTNQAGIKYSDNDQAVILELGSEYAVEDLVAGVSDISGAYTGYIYDGKMQLAESHFNTEGRNLKMTAAETGKHELTISITDESDNTSTAEITVVVKDTTAPEIIMSSDDCYFATNTEYTVDEFVTEIFDYSEIADYHFVVNGIESDAIMYTEIGRYSVTVWAADIFGNEETVTYTVDFDDAPVLVGARSEIHISIESPLNPIDFLRAFDNTDGDITYRINVDYGDYNAEEIYPGVYPVEISVSDSHGLTTNVSCDFIVGEDSDELYSLYSEEVQTLIDYDYFIYEPLDEDDYDLAVSAVEPCLVNLLKRNSDGGYTIGSGFIYKIDSDYVYISTVNHVIADFIGHEIEIMFCDENASTLYVTVNEYERVDVHSENAMFRLPIYDLPADVLLDLGQIHVDENIYETMYYNQRIVCYSGHWSNTTPTIRDMYLLEMDVPFDYYTEHCIKSTFNTKGGMSGSPVFDLKGRLVGLCEGYWKVFNYDLFKYEYFGYSQRIDGIEEIYERLKANVEEEAA